MKAVGIILSKVLGTPYGDTGLILVQIFFSALLLVEAGCGPAQPRPPQPPAVNDKASDKLHIYTRYVPVKIDIIPLSEFVCVGGGQEPSKIKVYVSLLDSFGCQIKSPGTLRFELYRYVPRSAEPKGRRIAIWPDINLTDAAENNNYWQDFFRSYEFALDFRPEKDQSYILEATCLCPNGRRLSDDFVLKYIK